MTIKGNYRKAIYSAILIFLIINVLAIFYVFNKYHSTNKLSQKISKTKLKYSSVKKDLSQIQEFTSDSTDSFLMNQISRLELEELYLDSLLNKNDLSKDDIQVAEGKMKFILNSTKEIKDKSKENLEEKKSEEQVL